MKKKRESTLKPNWQKIQLPNHLHNDNPHLKTLIEATSYEEQLSALNSVSISIQNAFENF